MEFCNRQKYVTSDNFERPHGGRGHLLGHGELPSAEFDGRHRIGVLGMSLSECNSSSNDDHGRSACRFRIRRTSNSLGDSTANRVGGGGDGARVSLVSLGGRASEGGTSYIPRVSGHDE